MSTFAFSAAALHVPTGLTILGNRSCQDEDMQTLLSEDDRESLNDEEERASKRNKLTEQVQAVGFQVKQLQDRMGLASTSTSQADLTGNRITPVQVTQDDLSFLFGSTDSNARSAHQL
ncbi:hypothetical protein WJX79_006504 [Trebouxia sp. C0005]